MKKILLSLLMAVSLSAYAAQQPVNVGTVPNDGTGDPVRAAFQKLNANDTELYASAAITQGATFNVKTYGAVCDGGTDDSAAFVTTANAAAAAGGIIYIPSGGNCVIGAPISLGSNVTVSGYGATLTAKVSGFPWSTNAVMFTNIASASNIVIRGVNFVYPPSATGATHIIQLTSTASNVRLVDNTSNYGGDFLANIGATHVVASRKCCHPAHVFSAGPSGFNLAQSKSLGPALKACAG